EAVRAGRGLTSAGPSRGRPGPPPCGPPYVGRGFRNPAAPRAPRLRYDRPTDPRILLPTEAQVTERLEAILARGNRKLGYKAGHERLLLMLTRSCELRCSYCFVQKTESGTDMSVEVAERGVDLLMRSTRPKLEV